MRASDIAQRCAALQLQSDIKNELDRFQSGHVCAIQYRLGSREYFLGTAGTTASPPEAQITVRSCRGWT
jgi:hypothetical protein